MRRPGVVALALAGCHAAAGPPALPSRTIVGQRSSADSAATGAPPPGFAWRDRRGAVGLAARVTDEVDEACEVWDLERNVRLGRTDGSHVSAGGAEPTCEGLSPRGTLVRWGNGRNTVWKNWQNQVTACRGVVAPDDSSCIEEDVTPFMSAGADAHGDDLELHWARPIVDGPTRLVVTIPDGLDRDGDDERWWSVRYCSATSAIIELRDGERVLVDGATGDTRVVHVPAGTPPCP